MPHKRLPQNRAQGRIEDALAAILDPHEQRTLNELLERLPQGWSRAEAVSALADGVLDTWIGANGAAFQTRYWLRSPPPPLRADPLAERFNAMRLRARLEGIDRDLSELLQESAIKKTGDIGRALANARTNTQLALKHINV